MTTQEEMDLIKMELHDRKSFVTDQNMMLTVIRVPGGWLYITYHTTNQDPAWPLQTFVPIQPNIVFPDPKDLDYIPPPPPTDDGDVVVKAG